MANLGDVVINSIAEILSLGGTSPEDVWNGSVWTSLRQQYDDRLYWYKGDEWQKGISGGIKDEDGNPELKYPLQLNPIAKMCRVHRAVMLGMQQDSYNAPPVKTSVSRSGLLERSDREIAERAENFYNNIWWQNNGGSLQFESTLAMQYYGGSVFRLNWEPFNRHLPNRIALYYLDSPSYFLPVSWSPSNQWRILECYIGYEIPAETAKILYGITPKEKSKENVLYLEHWTEDEYQITVDGKVPVFQVGENQIEQQGENPWRVVPVTYIPHERDGGFFGRSLIDGDSPLAGMAKELNARMADRGEAVRDARDIIWGKNIRQGSITARVLNMGGGIQIPLVDVGGSTMPNSPEPELDVAKMQGPPKSAEQYDADVWSELMNQADVAPVALGRDDTGSGRITGPVTAYRMWPTMQHTMAERMYYTDGLRHLANVAMRIGLWAQAGGEFARAGVRNPPQLDERMLEFSCGANWRPMIPIEVETQSRILNERLQAGGISVHDYLVQQGVSNPDEEEERIWSDRERQAELEAMAQAEQLAARLEAMNIGMEEFRQDREGSNRRNESEGEQDEQV